MFQVYDTDNSGSISVDEFETISSNFPFIQAFSDLDMDKWVYSICPGGRNDFGPSNVLLILFIGLLLMFSPPLPPRDGVISKDEMTQYFLGAYQSLRRIFKHNFQECSYLSPTYCDHCKGRLIGYVRQGYKCKGELQGVCVHWYKGSTSVLFNSCVEVFCVCTHKVMCCYTYFICLYWLVFKLYNFDIQCTIILSPLVDCNINCHKDCKDSVVVECHRRDKRGE